MRPSKLPGSVTFQLQIAPNSTISRATSETLIDLSAIPEDYHKFANVFNKGKADALPPHWGYDLKIDLERKAPPSNHMYSLSPSELETLWEFIEEHVNIGFIRPSKSPLVWNCWSKVDVRAMTYEELVAAVRNKEREKEARKDSPEEAKWRHPHLWLKTDSMDYWLIWQKTMIQIP